MTLDNLADAFYDELRDIFSAEKQLTQALPQMVKNASSNQLRETLYSRVKETEQHVERVEQAFADTGKAARAKTCEAMKGLIVEAQRIPAEEANPAVKDVVMLAAAQKIEHYGIASYGTLCTWAELLGYENALNLLKQNLAQEEAADEKLSQLAASINQTAMEASLAGAKKNDEFHR